jgi:hypothetical protein
MHHRAVNVTPHGTSTARQMHSRRRPTLTATRVWTPNACCNAPLSSHATHLKHCRYDDRRSVGLPRLYGHGHGVEEEAVRHVHSQNVRAGAPAGQQLPRHHTHTHAHSYPHTTHTRTHAHMHTHIHHTHTHIDRPVQVHISHTPRATNEQTHARQLPHRGPRIPRTHTAAHRGLSHADHPGRRNCEHLAAGRRGVRQRRPVLV